MLVILRSCILVFLLTTVQLVFAQTIQLSERGEHEVKGHMQFLRDTTNNLTLDDVPHATFAPLPNALKSPGFGFDRTTYWFSFAIHNTSGESDWLMEIPYAPLDEVDFYLAPDAGSVWYEKKDGDIFPISQRDLPHRHPIFKFAIAKGQTKTIYLRVKTISSVQVPVIFWTPEEFHIASYRTQLINGLFFGAMFVMIFYQLFLFVAIRDRTTFYYVLTLIGMVNILGFFQGYNFLYLYPEIPRLNDDFAALAGPLFVFFSALLTRSFLNIKQFSKILDRALMINALLSIIVGIIMVVFNRQISYKYHHLFILFHCIIILASASYCLYKKYRPALFYLIAWVSVVLATVAFTMATLGYAPAYLGTNYQGLMIGCIMQVLLISLALGERYNILVKENEAAKELELRRGHEENIRLEREVQLRTEELFGQKDKLEELNKIKDKLFSIVSHDIKEPLTSLKLSLALVKMDRLTQSEFKEISGELEKHLDNTTDFIQNLLQWAKFQLRGEEIKRAPFDLIDLLNETVSLLSHQLRQKGLTVSKVLPDEEVFVNADVVMIQSVLRNLLTNAIKFTKPGDTITIAVQREDNRRVVVSVRDKGAGIPEKNRDKIFTLESIATMGTKSESGTGLGLVLCKEFVERNTGEIWFDTSENGTTFFFSMTELQDQNTYKMDRMDVNKA